MIGGIFTINDAVWLIANPALVFYNQCEVPAFPGLDARHSELIRRGPRNSHAVAPPLITKGRGAACRRCERCVFARQNDTVRGLKCYGWRIQTAGSRLWVCPGKEFLQAAVPVSIRILIGIRATGRIEAV